MSSSGSGYHDSQDDVAFDDYSARKEWQEEAKKLGRFNLAVFGKTGVGKSTLVNAIFGYDVAPTGIGAPVTDGSQLYVVQSGALGLYDTRGLEIGVSGQRVLADVTRFIESKRSTDASEHIHAVYYCIRAGDQRIEPAEEEFIQGIHALGLPVFLVLTQVHKKGDVIRPEHLTIAQHIYSLGLPIYLGRPFLTAALPDTGLGYDAHGLVELVEATYQAAPEAARAALAAAQMVDRGLKRRAAKARIKVATGLAAGVGATPIPFSDAALLVPIQIGMMASISQTYRVPMDAAMAASLAATALATNMGKTLAASALKFVPGAGTVAGSAVAASVASAFTLAMGEAWMKVCEMMVDGRFGPLESMDNGAVRSVFADEFKGLFSQALRTIKRSGGSEGSGG